MTADQEQIINNLITEAGQAAKDAREAKSTYTTLIRIFAVAIFIAVSSVSVLTWQIIHLSNNSEYIRQNAVSIKAFAHLMDTYKINSECLSKLINDEDIQKIVLDFNQKTDAIVDRIILSETEIVPRGVIESR